MIFTDTHAQAATQVQINKIVIVQRRWRKIHQKGIWCENECWKQKVNEIQRELLSARSKNCPFLRNVRSMPYQNHLQTNAHPHTYTQTNTHTHNTYSTKLNGIVSLSFSVPEWFLCFISSSQCWAYAWGINRLR